MFPLLLFLLRLVFIPRVISFSERRAIREDDALSTLRLGYVRVLDLRNAVRSLVRPPVPCPPVLSVPLREDFCSLVEGKDDASRPQKTRETSQ